MIQCYNSISQESSRTPFRLKYLEKGRTFMRGDAIQVAIRKKNEESPIISTFNDFVSLVSK